MRHAKARHQLNRFSSWYKATLKGLARDLLIQQSIKTTRTRAKAVQPLIEKLITLAKVNTQFGKRQAFKILGDHRLVSLLFSDIGQRFNNRVGGYTRIVGLGKRRGDNAEMVILELSEIKKKEKRKAVKKEEGKEEKPQVAPEKPAEEKKTKTETAIKEKPPETKKPTKKFLGGIRNIFKKERDSL